MNESAKEARRKYYREYKSNISPEAREAYNRYNREWRRKNPDKIRQYNVTYWERKAAQGNDPENLPQRVNQLKEQGRSLREIGHQLGISHMKVKRLLQIVTEA